MGLEPTTSCLQSRCSSQLSYVPVWKRSSIRYHAPAAADRLTAEDGARPGQDRRYNQMGTGKIVVDIVPTISCGKNRAIGEIYCWRKSAGLWAPLSSLVEPVAKRTNELQIVNRVNSRETAQEAVGPPNKVFGEHVPVRGHPGKDGQVLGAGK
jgi:hypothetical protein